MATNAPYFQMPSVRSTSKPNSSNAATPPHFESSADECDLPVPAAVLPLESHQSLYSEHRVHQPPSDALMNSTEENHHLAELLEAATTAADQAAQAMDVHNAGAADRVVQVKGRRRRTSNSPADEMATSKRLRVDVPTDPQLQVAELTSIPPSKENLLGDARTAGVHSAAALFRPSSGETSRKQSRPPMSKLYMSLRLTPENFLILQAQAKAYMLDAAYPERQNCVGSRNKGDTDMVKLKLFNCVQKFLNDGAGQQFFGENVDKQGEREVIEAARALGEDKVGAQDRLTWPKDEGKLISLVTPLMRRMVTNERQRIYAIKTRKGGAKNHHDEDSVGNANQQVYGASPVHSPHRQTPEQQPKFTFDPSLSEPSRTQQSTSSPVARSVTPSQPPVAETMGLQNQGSKGYTSSNVLDIQPPIPTPADPVLTNINIFLVFAPHPVASGTMKPCTKLDEKRISRKHPDHLTKYPWNEFSLQVINLLDRAKTMYPAICVRSVSSKHRITNRPVITDTANNVTDNLRELAAAANAIQGEHDATGGYGNNNSATENLLPRHVIKTVGPSGWEFVENAEQWVDLLVRRSREVWADGVLNVVVELVDVPVGLERGF